MTTEDHPRSQNEGGLRQAARFWEKLRPWYTAILAVPTIAWLTFSWPHFRGSVSSLLLWLVMFLAVANLCYCAGYIADALIRAFAPQSWRRALRVSFWIAGLLLSLLVENYWIADEIYPDAHQGTTGAQLFGGTMGGTSAQIATNLNFPAPLAVVGFLMAVGGLLLATAAILILLFARKPKLARRTGITGAFAAVIYFGLLIGFSAASHTKTLGLGQEKYFCEIDCHLAYAVVSVDAHPNGETVDYSVALRTRFDEKTISTSRPKDAPLTPSPREVRIVDSGGHEYAPASVDGTSLMTPLSPAESYTSRLQFQVPQRASGLRLLLRTVPAWPDHMVIGDENSWMHKKTYFAL
jgi:hypothetical protein